MSYVTVPRLTAKEPAIPGIASAAPLVMEKFADAREYAGSAFEEADKYLEVLSTLFARARMPDVDIDYDFQDLVLDPVIGDVPTVPTDSQLTPGVVTPPTLGEIIGIPLPSIDIPVDNTGSLVVAFNYDEAPYSSELLDAVKASLLDYVENGGTGLSDDVEAALWARAQARQDIVNERVYNEALNYFSARGFTLPPGALGGRLTEALAEQTRALAQLNYEIMIEQARLAQDMTKHTLMVSVQLEGVEKKFASDVANRALDKAKTACDVIIRAYSAKVAAYVARCEAVRTTAQIEEIKANIQIAANANVVEVYRAEIDGYKARVAMELGIVETIAKVYVYKVTGYKAEADVAIALLEGQIKVFEGRVTQATNQTTLSLKEAELILNSYIGALALQKEAAEGSATIAAQLAASALNSVNASATLGYSVARSRADGVTATQAVSNIGALTERHTFDHEA